MTTKKVATSKRASLLVPAYFQEVRQKVRLGYITRDNNPAYRRLINEAEELLSAEPLSVVQKIHTPPSGDKRDYFSLSIYFWPNEATPDGLPYVPRDGVVNPEVDDYDGPRFGMFYEYVDTLSVAFALSDDERFAAKATELLRTWFVDERTRMNPNMLFAQYIPGENVQVPWKEYPARFVPGSDGRKGVYVSYGGVIEDHHLIPLTDCISLLRASTHWRPTDEAAIIEWYRAYAEWLLTHQHGLDEAACRNNHGSWYWAGVICFLNFSGQSERACEYAAKNFPERLQMQIEPDGSQPEELVRAISQTYTAFTLCSFTNMALAAKQCGYDAWSFQTSDGRSLAKAMDWFLPYLTGEKPWSWKQIKPFQGASMIGPLCACADGYKNYEYKAATISFAELAEDDRARILYDVTDAPP